jgi:polyisoprenyl-phosphate glycosyltransferase
MSASTVSNMKARVSVVLPIYRTVTYMRELHQRLTQTLKSCSSDYEIIMVDDGSPDNAWQTMTELAATDPHLKVLKLSRNFGQHPAISAGFDHATGDYIILMDADLQDRPEDIPRLLEKFDADTDVVYTVKENLKESFSTQITSRLYHYVFSRLTRTVVPRNIGTFRAFSRRFLESMLGYPEKAILFGPLMFHIGFKSVCVPVAHDARKDGHSSYSFRRRLELAVNSLLSYTDLPHRLMTNLGIFILCGCVIYSFSLVINYIITKKPLPPGLTLLALILTVSLGLTMFSLGIIGTYVFRVYQEVLCRPRYIVARSMNVDNLVPTEGTKHRRAERDLQGASHV